MVLTQPGASTMLGASGPTSQKDWYPHPKNGLRSNSQLAKSQITVRPVRLESPYRIYERRNILKPDRFDNATQQSAIDQRMIAGEMRVVFPAINVNPATNGTKSARANAVLELAKKRSEAATTRTIIPSARRRPRCRLS